MLFSQKHLGTRLATFAFYIVTAYESIIKALRNPVVNKPIYNEVTQCFPNLFKHASLLPAGSHLHILQIPMDLGNLTFV